MKRTRHIVMKKQKRCIYLLKGWQILALLSSLEQSDFMRTLVHPHTFFWNTCEYLSFDTFRWKSLRIFSKRQRKDARNLIMWTEKVSEDLKLFDLIFDFPGIFSREFSCNSSALKNAQRWRNFPTMQPIRSHEMAEALWFLEK